MDPPASPPLPAKGPTSTEENTPLKLYWRQSPSSVSYHGPNLAVEDSRGGFPKPLPRLPAQSFAISGGGDEKWLGKLRSCKDEAREIVTEGLLWGEICVFLRKEAGEAQPFPTLIIILLEDIDHGKLESALVTIGYMLHEKNVKDLRVEIAGPNAYAKEEERVFVMDVNHPIVELWPRQIRLKVLDLLRDVRWSEVGVYTYGYNFRTAVPTVTIAVKDDTCGMTEEFKRAIEQVCAENGAPGMRVAVLFGEIVK